MLRRVLTDMFLVVALMVAFSAKGPAAITPSDSRKAAPDFTLTDAKGAPVRLSDYKGKIVLLDFWATWCHGCMTEIPWYIEFQDKYKNSGLAVVGVSMDDDGWKSVRPFLEQNKLNYPVVIGDAALGKRYNVDSMPVTLLIDRDGRIAVFHSGMVDRDAFENEVRTLLRGGSNYPMQ